MYYRIDRLNAWHLNDHMATSLSLTFSQNEALYEFYYDHI